MKSSSIRSVLLALAFLFATSSAFSIGGSATGGSSFVVSSKGAVQSSAVPSQTRSSSGLSNMKMGSQAKFGIFSPAVYVAKIALGQEKLNKIRGKAISLHSQAIGDFCEWAGAYHLRTRLIKKAKVNGDTLGFLV